MKKIFAVAIVLLLLAGTYTYAQTDTRLNGNWGMTLGGIEMEYVFNNGNYEFSTTMEALFGITVTVRGTYTTSGDTITFMPSHVHGASLGLESRWFTQNELRSEFANWGLAAVDFNQLWGAVFIENTFTYTIKGNTISFSQPIIFTRR